MDVDVANPLQMCLSHRARFGHSRSNRSSVIMNICQKNSCPAFQGHSRSPEPTRIDRSHSAYSESVSVSPPGDRKWETITFSLTLTFRVRKMFMSASVMVITLLPPLAKLTLTQTPIYGSPMGK